MCVCVFGRCRSYRLQWGVWGGVSVAGGLPYGLHKVTDPGDVYDGATASRLLQDLHRSTQNRG